MSTSDKASKTAPALEAQENDQAQAVKPETAAHPEAQRVPKRPPYTEEELRDLALKFGSAVF